MSYSRELVRDELYGIIDYHTLSKNVYEFLRVGKLKNLSKEITKIRELENFLN